MAGFEEVRPLEGMWAPLQARLDLRRTFERWLLRPQYQRPAFGQVEMVDESGLLDLCQYYRLEYPGGAGDVAKSWDESEQRIADGGPTFNDLIRSGWVVFDGGRWIVQSTPLGTLSHITYPSPSTKIFLTGLGKARLVAKTRMPPLHARELANRIAAGDWLERHIPTSNPDRLASRLWERLCPRPQAFVVDNSGIAVQTAPPAAIEAGGSPAILEAEAGDVDRAFLEWSTWCDVLGCAGRWDPGWGPAEMRYCREAAFRALDRQLLWGGWDNDVARYADLLDKTFAIPQGRLRYAGAPKKAPPQTLVSRVDWLRWPDVEHFMMERRGVSTVSFAFGVLCSELEKTDIGPNITATVSAILLFAADHPMALQQLLFRIDAVPALLVDMLMHPRIVCVAAKLVIEWRPAVGPGSDRHAIREAQTKAFAVQDALSLLAYHLNGGTLDLEECASLVTWCYDSVAGNRRAIADSRRPIGRQLLRVIAKEREESQSAVLQYLVGQAAYENNIPRVRFAGVLDGLNCLLNAPGTDVSPIVELYSKFARDLHLDWTDAFNLSADLAARLVATAFAQAAPARDALLVPFDSAKVLQEAPDDEAPTLRFSIARTLRGHVRLLARAIAGWPDATVPGELRDAFLKLVSRSAIEHAEKGRVGALTDRHSPSRFLGQEDGSPAQDLAAAWQKLDGGHRTAMLQALAQSDDPVLLAELCQYLPADAKPGIQARLRQLKPREASELWTWPELQHRIEALLAAGEYGLAREHLGEARPSLDRAPPQFRLSLFRLELQLLLKEKNWVALDGTVVPSALDEYTTRQAQDQLDFYQATSQLLRPNGNLAGAQAVLQRLAARPDAAPAYRENFFAIALQQLLGPTLHPLTDADKVTGEGLLAEINATVAADETLASINLLANRGLLLLSLRRPEDALKSVAVRRQETRSPELELITVLAKWEMGFQVEAMAILDAAITEFDGDSQLTALKNDLRAGDTTRSTASVSVTADLIKSIRIALQQLAELQPSQVGDILGPSNQGVRGYLIRQVSHAVAVLQHMAAMLRDRKNPEDDARFEDDLNTAVRKLLEASLEVPKWNVVDQSLGGSTANGNPGKRDAVIRASGREISIYEALVCSGLDRTNIKAHFDKLFSYGSCDVYFHVIYSYAKHVKPLLDYVRQMLEHEVPPGLAYLNCEPLTPPDCEISGYIATYRFDHLEIAVVFLVADLKVSGPLVAEAATPTS